jgi:predicted HNH restriction endonuclease
VLCGCFDPGLNARAPFEIDVGDLPKVTQYAQLLVQQGHEIPVFLKRGTKAWEYVGQFRAVRYNTDPEDLYPRQPRRADAVAILYLARSGDETVETVSDDSSVTSQAAAEGGRSLVQHLRQERSRALVDAKRRAFREKHGHLHCEACGLSEASLPSAIGEGCFEVHHTTALASRQSSQVTRIDDLALVCANCHRMIHRGNPMLTVEQLRSRLEAQMPSHSSLQPPGARNAPAAEAGC